MEYKLIPLLRYSSLVLLFLAISVRADDYDDDDDDDNNNNYNNEKTIYSLSSFSTPPIYLGDTDVNVGHPFSISCIISIRDPIHWIKDGELIKKFNNIRHKKDEHAFIETENNLEGEGDENKIEATINVKKALKQHKGKYQCNSLHTNYHLLHVHKYDDEIKEDLLMILPTKMIPTTVLPIRLRKNSTTVITPTLNSLKQYNDMNEEEEKEIEEDTTYYLNKNYDNYNDNDKYYSINFPISNINDDDLIITDITDADYQNVPSSDKKKIHNNNNNLITLIVATTTNSTSLTNNLMTDDSSIITQITPQLLPSITITTLPSILNNDTFIYINTTNENYFTLENIINNQLNILILTNNSNDDITTTTTNTFNTTTTPTTTEATVTIPITPTITTDIIHVTPVITETLLNIDIVAGVDKTTTDADILVPNYDNIEQKLKAFEIRSPLVLSCNITIGGDYELNWLKNGTDVSEHSELEKRYTIKKVERQFVIPKTLDSDAGIYTCSVKDLDASKNITVVANVVVKLPQSTAVVEGEKLRINCIVLGTDPEITWKNGNDTYNETSGRVTLTEDDNKVPNAVIIVDNIVLEDRGNFTCIAKNLATKYAKYHPAESTTFVRVKGKLAALWPFLGICGEVFILCAIILIYEKRRNNAELDESDTDQSPEQKLDQHGKDTDVRHRK